MVEFFGDGGLPVGLIAGAKWTEFDVQVQPGERLLLASDGISECPDQNDNLLDDEGLAKIMRRNARLSGNAFFETLIWDLSKFADDRPFPDDISAVLLEYSGTG